MFITWESILGRHLVLPMSFFYLCLPCDLFSIMDEAKVNENLLASTKSLLDDSLNELKRSHAVTADSHLKEIKKLKFDEPHRFRKRGNEDQYRFNLKVSDAIEEAKDACFARQFDKSLIREYKRNDLAEDSDDERKIIKAEARARTQANQSGRLKSRPTNRREPTALTTVTAAASSQ
ncbi:hypothetical protein pdam_00024545 [Pocillopora damicornis]|uniref:Uncharacterized protein n=1 Tax=Pocillopora damicornis TaxID=46731 RepID=A0A3M6UZJ2_POCDA|nr:hypothetical protein pdam_00024545 [Pocillopora damicornis]